MKKKWTAALVTAAIVGIACGGTMTTATELPTSSPSIPSPTVTPSPSATPIATTFPRPTSAAKYHWEFFNVDAGAKPSLKLDSIGNPNIAFMLEDSPHGFVKYAEWNGSGFDITQVADGYFYGPLDLAIGPDERPHISWHDHQDPMFFMPDLGDLTYATRINSEWHTEFVFSTGHDGWDSSIAVDSAGNVHIVAVDPFNFLREQGVEHYFFNGQKWTVEEIGSVPLVYEWGTSLVLDSAGRPHVSYFDSEAKDLYYAFKSSHDEWKFEAVDTEGDVGRFPSLILDSLGLPMISYLKLLGPDKGVSQGYMKFAQKRSQTPGDWEVTRIDKLDNLFMGFLGARKNSSLVLDRVGNPIFAYSDDHLVKVAYYNGETWNTEVVLDASDRHLGQLVSMAIDSEGTLHLAFTELQERTEPGIFGMVKYAVGIPSP